MVNQTSQEYVSMPDTGGGYVAFNEHSESKEIFDKPSTPPSKKNKPNLND